MQSLTHHVKEFRLYSVVSGKAIKNSKRRDIHVWCVCDKKGDVGSVKGRLEKHKHRSRRLVKGHCIIQVVLILSLVV